MPSERAEKLFGLVEQKLKKRDEGKEGITRVHRATDSNILGVVPWGLPTRIAEMDLKLGGKGGLPAGRTVELYASPYLGKSTLALQIAASAIEQGGLAAYIETEKNVDTERIAALGCDLDNMLISTTDTLEGAFRIAEDIITNYGKAEEDSPLVVIIDSVGAAGTEAELSGEFKSEPRPGHEAKQIKAGMRRITRVASRTNVIPIFVNHAIAKIGAMPFAKQHKAAGGQALGFFSSVRMCMSAKKKLTYQKKWMGQLISFEIEKIRGTVIEDLKFEVNLLNENGFDRYISLHNAGIDTGFIKEEGNAFNLWAGTEDQISYKVTKTSFNYEEFKLAVETSGGFEKVYQSWRHHAILGGFIKPWEGTPIEETVSNDDE